jgi:tetratricopeptide (TPR) repeat protein
MSFSDKPAAGHVIRRFNSRLVVKTILICAAIIPICYGWHRYQVQRGVLHFLETADRHEAAGDWKKAADALFRYVSLIPSDAEARIRLARTFLKSAVNAEELQRASEFYALAIGLAPESPELHREYAQILLRNGNPISAVERARIGLKLIPKDPACLKTVAHGLCVQFHVSNEIDRKDVTQSLGDALQANPRDIQLAIMAADFHRQDLSEQNPAKRSAAGDAIMNQLVAAAPDDPDVLLARYHYRKSYGISGDNSDLEKALRFGPKHAGALYADGQRDFDRRAYAAAEKRFKEAIEADPQDNRGYLGLAKVLSAQGKRAEAVEVLRRGIRFVGASDFALRSDWAALLTAVDRLTEAEQIIDSLERTAASVAPLMNAAERQELRNGLRLLRAQWQFAAESYPRAIQDLRAMLTTPVGARTSGMLQHSQGYSLLGNCHAALGQWDLAASAFDQSARLQPTNAHPRLQHAQALEQSGRLDAAIVAYETALRLKDVPGITATSLARCRLRYQMNRPEAERNWAQFEKDLIVAQQGQADEIGLIFLQASFAADQGRTNDALAILQKAESDLSDVVEIWPCLAIAYQQWERPRDSDRAWLRFRQLSGATAEEVLLRCDLLCRRKKYEEAQAYIKERLPSLSGDSIRKLRLTSALVELRAGRAADGVAQLLELSHSYPNDLTILEHLGGVLFELGRNDDIAKVEVSLRRIEGEDGCLWRELECRRLFAKPAAKSAGDVARLVRLQKEVETVRPNWPRGYWIKGMLAELQDNPTTAISAYERAIQLGDQRPDVLQQLIPLLYRQNRLSDAERYLSTINQDDVVDNRTTLLSVTSHLRGGRQAAAVEIAENLLRRSPTDPMAKVWLGQTMLLAGRTKEAETILKQAVAAAPGDPRTWMGLFGFHLQANDQAAARSVLAELGKHEKLDQTQRHFIQAQGYEMLGDDKRAKEHFLEARRLAPNDVLIQQACGLFLLKSSPNEAEASLRRVLDLSPSSGSARRALASVLAVRGGEQAWQEAWSLLEGNSSEASVSDQRLKAVLLARRGTPANRRQALQIIEELVGKEKSPTAADRLLLARLYDDAKDPDAAEAQLKILTTEPDCELLPLATFADFLLRHRRWNDATSVIKRLEARIPDSFTVISLRAKWFQGQEKTPEIRPLIDGFVSRGFSQYTREEEKSQLLLEAAQLYTSLNMRDDAERQFRRLVDIAPANYRFLARFLVLIGRTSEAVELCVQAASSQDASAAGSLLCTILARGQATAADYARAEPILQDTLKHQSGDTAFLFSLATLRYFQKRKEEALEAYMKLLESNPEHVAALNNVANLLSEMPQRRDDSVQYIRRALAVQGPHPDLLDTLGMVLLRRGEMREALETLEQVCSNPSPDPRFLFHLAIAYLQNGDPEDARTALQKAKQADLVNQGLSADERATLTSLERQLAEK